MRFLNQLLKPFGVILLPRTSAKMLTESSNIVEQYWNSQWPSSPRITSEIISSGALTPAVQALVDEVSGSPRAPSKTVLWLRNAADQLHPGGDEYK